MLTRIATLTPDDKREIKAMCKEAGIEVALNTRCRNCHADALMLLRRHYGLSASSTIVTTAGGGFCTDAATLIEWHRQGGKTILSSQSDNETIEAYISAFPNQKTFKRLKTKGETNDN